jgi:hypothetical protein
MPRHAGKVAGHRSVEQMAEQLEGRGVSGIASEDVPHVLDANQSITTFGPRKIEQDFWTQRIDVRIRQEGGGPAVDTHRACPFFPVVLTDATGGVGIACRDRDVHVVKLSRGCANSGDLRAELRIALQERGRRSARRGESACVFPADVGAIGLRVSEHAAAAARARASATTVGTDPRTLPFVSITSPLWAPGAVCRGVSFQPGFVRPGSTVVNAGTGRKRGHGRDRVAACVE